MTRAVQYHRLFFVTLLLASAFVGLGYRLVDLQVCRHEEFVTRADANTHRAYLVTPRRGEIRDSKGLLLATSLPVYTICADPSLMGSYQGEIARTVAPILQLNEAELAQKLIPRTRTNDHGVLLTNKYVVLKHKVTFDTWQQVTQAMARIPASLEVEKLPKIQRPFYYAMRRKAIYRDPIEDQIRIYPNQRLAAHVLGYVGVQKRTNSNLVYLETTGASGVELMCNSLLSGVRGWRVTEQDHGQNEMPIYREQDVQAQDGVNVVLTLDAGLQHIIETELLEAFRQHSPISISAVAVRPRTGEILAMTSLPNYDPNMPGQKGETSDHWRNRVISDMAEPGSTFKIVVVSGALDENLVTLNTRFFCENGRFLYAGKILRDHGAYGNLTVEEIITQSSNIGAAKIGLEMGELKLHQYIRNFGFGSRTGIGLPGEIGGVVHVVSDWNKLSITRIPMGHEVASTPLQTAMAMAAIANNGVLMRPMIIDHLEDRNGNIMAKYQPQTVRRVISESAAKQMVTALKTVVSKKGTAQKAALEHYTVAGKTGTAQKAAPGGGGYMPGKYFSSFIGFFPADAPEIVISIVMDEPHEGYYGGQICGPVFKSIAEKAANLLDIRPDIQIEESVAKTDGLSARH